MKNGTDKCVDVIACGVLATDLKQLADALKQEVRLHFLPGGLHATPDRLREELQKTIDSVSKDLTASRIVIGYGVCGRGTVGLKAGSVPLVIPRVHDCIALFLGSDAEYRRQFSAHPGTYYLSAGWVEEKGDGGPRRNMGSDGAAHPLYTTFEQLADAYGEDNADYITDFMQSWTRNYTRSAFIDTGVGKSKESYAKQACDMANRFGWEYARLQGTHDLLIEALTTRETSDTILVVPPGSTTRYDGLRRRLDITVGSCTDVATAPASTAAPSLAVIQNEQRGIGLGIDAGGTYTDAVLYDFDRKSVISKNKALTTHWDYSTGIRQALAGLDAELLKKVCLTAVSTTVATNAIVEGHGQTVGLLVMPPCGWTDPEGFRHTPLAVIRGQLEIDGTEIVPIDPDQVRSIAKELIQRAGVTAFAIGGYAAHANPAHELQVKAILREATGLSVTCSHELSSALHYRIRAETAALNARIIPCLEALLTRITDALESLNLTAPVMIVRSDGSFMSLSAALERPLETMLSGPAASAAGAGWLANAPDALIADIGGTTTDTAILRNGRVRMNPNGASIGGWQTHIQALDLQTAGLGGDSHVHFRDQKIQIGPERVAPLCWLAASHEGTEKALDWIEAHMDGNDLSSSEMILLARSSKIAPSTGLTETEQRVLELLSERPYSLHELTARLQKPHSSMVPIKQLAASYLIQRCGITPTDALHASGQVSLWDARTACRAVAIHARRLHLPVPEWIQKVLMLFERTLAEEILKKQLSDETPVEKADQQPLAMAMINRILDRNTSGGFGLHANIEHPVIGIGAPAACFVPQACARIGANPIVPIHADVANAVGAVIGSIAIRREVRITTDETGGMRLGGVPDAPVYSQIEEATAAAETFLRDTLKALAIKAGCSRPHINISSGDNVAAATDGTAIFIGRTLEGIASGPPDL